MNLLQRIGTWYRRVTPLLSPQIVPGSENIVGVSTGDATQLALQSAAVWACCRLLSEPIGALPAHIFEETDEGKIKARKHPLYRILTRQPNAAMTRAQWIQTTVLHLCLYGNAFTKPVLVDGEVTALHLLDPLRMRIVFNGETSYVLKYYGPQGQTVIYSPLDLLHFRIFSLDGIIGLSPLEYHRMTFDSEAAAQLYATSIYRNGGRPSGVLKYQGQLRKEQADQIRESWSALHSGPDGIGRVAVLDNGTTYEAVGIPLADLEYIAQQRYSVEQIARIFGVPPHLVGALDKPTYASVEQQSLEFSRYRLQPLVTSLEQTIRNGLLEDPFIFRMNLAGFERADIGSRYRAYATGRQWGWFSANDIRELEELNRIGPEGDVYLTPLNMTAATDPDDAPVPSQLPGAPQ